MKSLRTWPACLALLLAMGTAQAGEDWSQFKFDSRHSGNAPDRNVTTPLRLVGVAPLTDAIFTAPVIADGRVYVVDGAGVAFCLDAATLRVIWKFPAREGKTSCNNICSPALAGRHLHFGTMAGTYYVLDAASGALVKEIPCGEPIFSAAVVGKDRVYFATLGSRVYALKPDGTICWTWDFVKEQLKFNGDRWSGEQWQEHKNGGVTWSEQFCCSRDIALHEQTLIIPAGGLVVWLEDRGDNAEVRGTHLGGPRESPCTLAMSVGESGEVYRQWTRRDNQGDVEVLRLRQGKVERDYVRGTETSYGGPGLIGFCSVSLRGQDVFRCRPQEGLGFCRHSPGQQPATLCEQASIAPPILLRDTAVYGGLDGTLYVVPLSGDKKPWMFKTAFGKAITAPVAVCDGRIYFGCEDGYLYVLGQGRPAPLPRKELKLWEPRSRLSSALAAADHNWFTSFGNFANTNRKDQGIRPPFRLKWIRRYEGTAKHFSVCGGGRMYTHTAEGQIFAVEQETGRLLWRRYFPGVHVSYTSPLYYKERLFVPQAGLTKCSLRCLNAATGELVWEAPFSGSPSWNRQLPPIIHKNLAIYLFSSGKYTPKQWLFEHQSTFGFPADQKPLLRAWDIETGKDVWTRDFSEYGSGGDDAGMCLMDGTLYYSCYFGNKAPPGITAAIEPSSGRVLWQTTKYAVHAGCTVSGKDGRLYLGGYNAVEDKINRVWCLDARDGSLIWKSDPVAAAIHVITIGEKFLFTHAQYKNSYLLDKETGKIISTLNKGYNCTRFTLSEPYLLGPNLEVFDLNKGALISSGPQIDVLECIGSIASNGRIFFTTNGGGMQASVAYGTEAGQ
ncbi:PQQ-binding-like beta-propeller repeat protein [Candidatus Sumerlaeota bacterium]|nr:PQQ-binding-like beta-propeller repeat protein [Candidatus Sumerlaeota bacterium]